MSIRRILGRAAAAAFAAALMVSAGLFFDPASAASLEVQGDNGADSSMPVYLTQEALKPADMLVTEQVTLTGTTATCSLKAQQPLVVTNNEDSRVYISEVRFVPENGWKLTGVGGTNFKNLPADSKVLGLKVQDHDMAAGPYRDFAIEANSSASLPVSGYSCPVSSDTTATAGKFQLTMSFFEMVISASADDASHGYVTGGGGCDQGGEVTLEAVANAGYGFDHWEDEEGNTVSTDATWTFKPTKSAHYTAIFSAPSGTTLYSDGTLVINEVSSKRAANTTSHGAVVAEYAAYTEGTTWNSPSTVPWVADTANRDKVKNVEFGSKTKPNNMAYWFSECRYLEEFDSKNLDTSNVISMGNMFYYAGYNADTFNLDLSGWDTSNVITMSYMFYKAGYNATTWDIGDISGWDTSKVTSMSDMFRNAGYNADTFNLDLSGWNTSKVTSMYYMFISAGYSATTWDIGDLSSWDTSNVTNMNGMFWSAGYNASTWDIGDISSWNTANVTDMGAMFYYAGYNATTFNLNISSWNTTKVTNMSYMFYFAGKSATTWDIGDLSSWNTANVTDMRYMFYNACCSAITFDIGDISGWNTSKVTDMSYMFSSAGYSATTWDIGDLSSWDVSDVTDMKYMFYYAGYNASTWDIGDLSSWDVSNVTSMNRMFYCAGYKATTYGALDLSGWNVANVTNHSSFKTATWITEPTWVQ